MAGETPTVVVDAENVRRSIWPNVSGERLVELVRRWAEERGYDYRVVFEGEDESADDRIVRETAELDRYWLVTSDRELRERAGARAERVIGGGADEAPEVYKRLPEVLAAHAGSVCVKHRLRPLGVAMAGRDVFDPFKD